MTAPEAPEELVLAGEFATPTRDAWWQLVAGVLAKSGREVDPAEDHFRGAPVGVAGLVPGLQALVESPLGQMPVGMAGAEPDRPLAEVGGLLQGPVVAVAPVGVGLRRGVALQQ